MDKLKMHTPDLAEENFRRLAALFPNAITETINENGEVVRAVDADILRQEISAEVVEGTQERYQFTWPDKKKSVVLANQPIAKTLRLDREKSVGRDGTPGSIDTENIYIEGDNLDALKLLQETYLGKVKMIYIDPPYNTGNDFIYEDDFSQETGEYLGNSGQFDEDGNRLVQNTESNGRFHTDWLNMLYPRLRIAKDLLSDDGVIFISIDDNEQENLKKICDEIFGEENFIACFAIVSNSSKNNARFVSVSHEYLLCFSKSKIALDENWQVKKNGVDEFQKRANQLVKRGLSKNEIHEELLELVKYPRFYELDHYTYADERGIYQTNDPGGVPNGNKTSEIIHPITGKPCSKPSGGWRYKEDEIRKKLANNEFEFGDDESIIPRPKRYIGDFIYSVPKSVVFFDSQGSTKWLKSENIPFDFPKAIDFIKWIISMYPKKDFILLDFFSGSATTAHAVMQLNAEDGGHRRFILVQLPETTDEKSEARKAGYSTICEIGEERIRRAGKKIREENPLTTQELDTGFRVFRVDSSNMEDVYYRPADFRQEQLEMFTDNIKPDRTPEDLLIQVMLDLGILLSSEIEETEIAGKKVFSVADGYLIACFDLEITEETVTEIAKKKPFYAVFRDSSMASDSVITNFEQIFETYSPKTQRKVL